MIPHDTPTYPAIVQKVVGCISPKKYAGKHTLKIFRKMFEDLQEAIPSQALLYEDCDSDIPKKITAYFRRFHSRGQMAREFRTVIGLVAF